MASRRSVVLDDAVAALEAPTATDLQTGATYTQPAGLSVFRTRKAALKSGNLPAIVVRRIQEENARVAGGHKDRRAFLFGAECLVGAADDGETVEDALDAITSWAVQAICNAAALQGGTGAIAVSTRDVLTKWEEADSDQVYGQALIGFSSDYITAAGNPDAA